MAADETTQALGLPWKLEDRPAVAVAFEGMFHEWGLQDTSGRELFHLRAGRGSTLEPVQAARAQHVLRAANAFEPMREALAKVKARIIEIGGTLPGGGNPYDRALRMSAAIPVPVEVMRQCMAALRAADGEGQPT